MCDRSWLEMNAWDVERREDGAVVVLGRNTIEPGAKYYLGKDCDAYRPGVGKGRWWYAASAFIIACALSDRADETDIASRLRSASRTAQPNHLMVRHADNLLARNGRMVAAIEALPPPLAALEADLFSIPSEFESA